MNFHPNKGRQQAKFAANALRWTRIPTPWLTEVKPRAQVGFDSNIPV
jgi:hypothetical protein